MEDQVLLNLAHAVERSGRMKFSRFLDPAEKIKAEEIDENALGPQIEKIIEEAGFVIINERHFLEKSLAVNF